MNNREQFDFYIKNGLLSPEMDVPRVQLLANKLLESLYKPKKPTKERTWLFVPDWYRIKMEGIDRTEPINWGGLKATIDKREGLYIVTIDEASPGECQTLCEFVEKYLTSWGWPVMVETEW